MFPRQIGLPAALLTAGLAQLWSHPAHAVGYTAGCQWSASVRSAQPARVLSQDSTPLPVSVTLSARSWPDEKSSAPCRFDKPSFAVEIQAGPNGVVLGRINVAVNPAASVGGSRVATGSGLIQTHQLPPGNYTVRPQFGPDGFPVTFALSVITPQTARVTTSISSHARVGQPINLVAHISGSQPSGKVDWIDRSTGAILGTAMVKNSVASAHFTPTRSETLDVIASYHGDKFNLPGESGRTEVEFPSLPIAFGLTLLAR